MNFSIAIASVFQSGKVGWVVIWMAPTRRLAELLLYWKFKFDKYWPQLDLQGDGLYG